MIEIKKVDTLSELKKFVNFQQKLYKNSEFFVPPLISRELETLRRDKNPSFEVCEAEYWLAYQNKEIVGRIAGIVNHRYIEVWQNRYARFGWFDFIDDLEVSKKMLETVENWAKSKQLTALHGPMGFTTLDRQGMLVDGFNEESAFSTIYNFDYYPKHLEKLGFQKDVDWLQYVLEIPKTLPERLNQRFANIQERYGFKIIEAKKRSELKKYARSMFDTYSQAYKHIFCAVPLTENQISKYINQYFGFIIPEFVCFVSDSQDRVIGFGITMPSLTKAFQKAKGRLFPFGFLHILKAMRTFETGDIMLIGVLPEYQAKGVTALIFNRLTEIFIQKGITKAVAYPQLEHNTKVHLLWKDFQHTQNIRRRCFIKNISQ